MRDADIRQILKSTKLSKYIADSHSKVVEEMKLPAAKAIIDMAVINGHLHGYEIKSASDTLQRLPGQIEAYEKVFDYLTIVTEERYYQKIVESTPVWIRVMTCSSKGFKTIRTGSINKNKNAFFIAKLLWHEELVDVLTKENIPFRKKDRSWLLCENLSNSLSKSALSKIVLNKLKERKDWKMKITADYEVV